MYTSAADSETTASQHSSEVIDLRSDTFTKPSPEMRRAMFEAEVGDDVYGEDPTINRLEKRAAEIFGREAALFVPSGTMGNQIAIKLHTHHGQEVICEARSHVFEYEMAMMAHFSGVLARTLWAEGGVLTWEHVKPNIRAKNYDDAKTGLVSLENTHNMGGGTLTPPEIFNDVCDRTHDAGLAVHLDGARVFNASVALGIPVAQLTAKADTVMFCLSKGLGAPVGSMLVGSTELMDRARIYRKALGGGMRQAGILAAAGLIALEQGPHEAGQGPRECKVSRRGIGPAWRYQDRSRQSADQHSDVRSLWNRHDVVRVVAETCGTKCSGQRLRPRVHSLCDAPRREPRAVRPGSRHHRFYLWRQGTRCLTQWNHLPDC